jgi:16S rRNA processing protein RimM
VEAPKYLTVGIIANTHGIRGELKVVPKTDYPEDRFAKNARLLLFLPNSNESIEVEVEKARDQKTVYIIKFKQYGNINEVEKYKGGLLKVSLDDQIEPEEDAFYFHEILGCTVIDEEIGELGKVIDILTPGANDVWVVKRAKGSDVLIPYIEQVVLDVNVKEKVIKVRLMEGLL